MHSLNGRRESRPTMTRRGLVRRCRQALYLAAAENWQGTRSGLRRRVRELLKPMRARIDRIDWMLRVVHEAQFAALVAGAVLATYCASSTWASPAIELSNVAAGTGGFSMNGEAIYDQSGGSISAAGDVNGDGLADLIVSGDRADPNGLNSGRTYVVFGKSTQTFVQLTDITAGIGGFAIDGEAADDFSGTSVSTAGDVNGDGLADLIVGAVGADPNGDNSGRTYVVFGKASGGLVQLSDITAGTGGFAINGEASNDISGRSVSAAGDVNGDGLADLIVGAPNGPPAAGRSYVIFGKTDGTLVQLSDVTAGTGGFAIDGESANDESGRSVSGAGDVNGDGLDDVIIGAREADANSPGSGRSYVVFGKTSGALIQLSDVTAGTGGFSMDGRAGVDSSGYSVSAAGDVNGDGLADLIVGAIGAGPNGISSSGRSYVIFGKATGALVQLSDVASGTGGFVIDGEAVVDNSGFSVSSAGDLNGDGLADLIVGAPFSDVNGNLAGRSYVVFGKTTGTAVRLTDVTAGTGGFTMTGGAAGDQSGRTVSTAGDVNGDGLADVIVGATWADPNAPFAGQSYVVFSPEPAAASATYKMRTLAGDGPGGNIVPESELPPGLGDVARARIDFADDNTADNGAGGASEETITITRSNAGISNLVSEGGIADVVWEITTDRTPVTDATLTLKYLDSEIAGLAGGENDLFIWSAPALSGPWTMTAVSRNPARNEISATGLTGLSFFSITSESQVIELSDITAGIGGFTMNGGAAFEDAGISVSTAGDVNGDGIADVVVGAIGGSTNGFQSGISYVVFGKSDGTLLELSDVTLGGSGGFAINGEVGGDFSGWSASAAGDVNGDGLADLIVGAFDADPNGIRSGRSYVVFGKTTQEPVELSDVRLGSGGFAMEGEAGDDRSGYSVSAAGDVNGDGLDDLIIGATQGNIIATARGRTYVIFGKTTGALIQLSDISAGTGGFAIRGEGADDVSGWSVSAAGDVDGDGLADVLIGAKYAEANGLESGVSYLVFGKASGSLVELSDITAGIGGFAINGEAAIDRSGSSVAGAGDVNGDGRADLLIGAVGADPTSGAGRAYVVFGKSGGALVELSNIAAGTGGFAIDGEPGPGGAGDRVAGVGDVNGDGLADLITGSIFASPNGGSSGRSYLIFGKSSGTVVQLSDIVASIGGFAINGEAAGDQSGHRVSGAGDVNGDGLADLIIGARLASPNGAVSGRSYVVFSPNLAPAVPTYKMTTIAGDGPGGNIVPKTELPPGLGDVVRVAIDFSDDDIATGGGLNGASTETITITRNDLDISNMYAISDFPSAEGIFDVMWEISTDRVGFDSADVTFKYLDSEIGGLSEAWTFVYTAPSALGPWTRQPTAIDEARNEATVTVTNFGFFALGSNLFNAADDWLIYE